MATDRIADAGCTRVGSPAPGLGPESEILLLCCRPLETSLRRERLQEILRGPVDFSRIEQFARKARVMPALATALSGLDGIPGPLMAFIQNEYRGASLVSLQLCGELRWLADTLEERSIPFLVYKGPALALACYGSLNARHYCDLDLLVRPQDALAVKGVLLEQGYRPMKQLSERQERRLLQWDCELSFLHPERGTVVEIHWNIVDRPNLLGFEVDSLWKRQVLIEIAGATVSTLSSEELFIVLCIHGGEKHRWARLKWVVDLARLLEVSRELDWNRIMRVVEAQKRTVTVRTGLLLSWLMLDTSLPEGILDSIRTDREAQSMAALTRGLIFAPEKTEDPSYADWLCYVEAHREMAHKRGGFRLPELTRLDYVRATMAPGWSIRRRWGLPRPLWFLYRFYRPLRYLYREVRNAGPDV